MRAFGFQNFEDHGARDLPCSIGVAQHLSIGINDQFVADPGIEKITGHRLIQWGRAVGIGSLSNLTSSLFFILWRECHLQRASLRWCGPQELLDPLSIWHLHASGYCSAPSRCNRSTPKFKGKDFTGELFLR